MPIQQARIPTLALLYATKRLAPCADQTPYIASNALNEKIGFIRTDITTLELPKGATVNAAKRSLLGGGGVDGAIHHAAGRELLHECMTLDGCETGSAKITGAYGLPCKKIIHAVGPVYDTDDDAKELLRSCYETCLKLAVENGLDAIAFPAIATGVYGYPSREAAQVALRTVREFMDAEDGQKLDLVVFCTFEKKDEDVYHRLIPLYFPPVEKSGSNDLPEKEDGAVDIAP